MKSDLGRTIRQAIRESARFARLRLLRLNLLARTGAHQPFAGFVRPGGADWRRAVAAASRGKRVVIATNTGGHFGLAAIDRLLAVALTLRGAAVTTILCDGVLPACQMCEIGLVPDRGAFVADGPPSLLCGYCHGPAAREWAALGLAAETIGAYISADDRANVEKVASSLPSSELASFVYHDLPLGEQALAGTLRFVARGTLDGEVAGEELLRRYLVASMLTALAYERILSALKPDVVVMHHGIYVPQGVVSLVAKASGVRVVAWNPAYRKHCFIFSHDTTYHHTLMDEPVDSWRDGPFSDEQRAEIESYIKSRWFGKNDWVRFHRDPDLTLTADLKTLGLDPDKKTILALTNVFWDAQLHYPANAFRNQRDWLVVTISWFAARPDLQLVIRIHPAEISGSPPSQQRAQDVIAEAFGALPDNVKIVPPESALSTYALAEHADAALIYATKMGVELSSVGLPVIVAGEAWVRNKGFTYDVRSPEDYLATLARLPFGKPLSPQKRDLALRYAHHFFFRRMVPISFVKSNPGPRRFDIAVDDLDAMKHGADHGLDVICGGILTGSPFIFDSRASA
ncbi:hypothetical protein IP69_14805 [Bosea sp. AAP35]|uniref:capsule biosynthesis protein n=1 Tax=Bosea sp. AAP35 TaxID=1523417 RepID=UPI0006CD83CC|nr:capsule biosynthesis protein [Bosea sp. AAP35]KPF66573.1 hypothetical protein IP69_14805 [Bosea sp. AAP35]